jgi:hypothetical protein
VRIESAITGLLSRVWLRASQAGEDGFGWGPDNSLKRFHLRVVTGFW